MPTTVSSTSTGTSLLANAMMGDSSRPRHGGVTIDQKEKRTVACPQTKPNDARLQGGNVNYRPPKSRDCVKIGAAGFIPATTTDANGRGSSRAPDLDPVLVLVIACAPFLANDLVLHGEWFVCVCLLVCLTGLLSYISEAASQSSVLHHLNTTDRSAIVPENCSV
jgi:hypothetical protein